MENENIKMLEKWCDELEKILKKLKNVTTGISGLQKIVKKLDIAYVVQIFLEMNNSILNRMIQNVKKLINV